MKKVILFFATAFLFVACNNDDTPTVDASIKTQEGEVRSRLSAGSENAEELKAAAEQRQKEREEREKERLATMTTMEIYPKEFDFGHIPKEKPVTTTFTIKNTGENPLIVNDTQASCGCTVPKKPEEPIMPGEEYPLEVTFRSNAGQAGTKINKTITVSANVPEASQVVNIKADVAN